MKKPSVVSFLITLMLAAVVCIQGSEPVVKDTNDDSVVRGGQYFIQPVKTASNNGGGLVPSTIISVYNDENNPLCPFGIFQSQDSNQPGLPVSFELPKSQTAGKVMVDVDLTIEFKSDNFPYCNEYSKFWEVDVSSSAPKEPAILTGGKPREKNSWFKIENAGEGAGANTYKLTTSTGTVGATPAGPWVSGPQVLVITNDTAKTLLVKFIATPKTLTHRVEKLGLRMFPLY